MTSVFNLCVQVIEKDKRHGGVTQSTRDKIDKFYAVGKLTETEYDRLVELMGEEEGNA